MKKSDYSPISRNEAEIALSGKDTDLICDTLLRVKYHDSDVDWIQGQCLRFFKHSDPKVRGLAVKIIGHLARKHGLAVNKDAVYPLLGKMVNDKDIAQQVSDAMDDVFAYCSDIDKMGRAPNRFLHKKYKDVYEIEDISTRWIFIGDILLGGTAEEVASVKCPVCKGKLFYVFLPNKRIIDMNCKDCGAVGKYGLGTSIPKLVEYPID